jgi:hypothetical protein
MRRAMTVANFDRVPPVGAGTEAVRADFERDGADTGSGYTERMRSDEDAELVVDDPATHTRGATAGPPRPGWGYSIVAKYGL